MSSERPIEELQAGEAHRGTLLPRADAHSGPGRSPLWFGWVIMDAFLAGIDWAWAAPPERPEGACSCDSCGKAVTYDLMVPDALWAAIAPGKIEGWKGGGVLCPECILEAALLDAARTAMRPER